MITLKRYHMEEKMKIKNVRILRIGIFTTIIWLIAHGYRYMNNLYTCDALVTVFQDDATWQRSLGRFLQPFVPMIRGSIVNPWLIFVITVAVMSFSIYLVAELFKLEGVMWEILLCGIFTCNVSMTLSSASFLPWVDIYAFAFCFAVLGVYFFLKDTLGGYILGGVSLVMCLGLYQAYINVALVLLVILTMDRFAEEEDLKDSMVKTVKILISLALSAGVYWGLYKAVLKIHHISAASSYNSLDSIGGLGDSSFISALVTTYTEFFRLLLNPRVFASTVMLGIDIRTLWVWVIRICVILIMIMIVAGSLLLSIKKKSSPAAIIIEIAGFVCLPLAFNFACLMSGGMVHELMTFSFSLLFAYALFVLKKFSDEKTIKSSIKYVALIPIVIILWNNTVFSNQIYFKLHMEDLAATSLATRMVDDIEDTEGYIPGVTPVYFVGIPENSEHVEPVMYLNDINIWGVNFTPFIYEDSLEFYIKNYLNVDMNFGYEDISDSQEKEMPSYPEKGSIRFVGDTLVVKISDRY